jgi:Domain of unknown function (DUF4258)
VTEKREYQYCGPERPPQRVSKHEASLSCENATMVIRKAWGVGRVHLGTHFKKRCAERGVDMLDIENLIRRGKVYGNGVYSEEYKNWKYRLAASSDDRQLEVVVALDPTEDYTESPLAVLLTVYERKEGQ